MFARGLFRTRPQVEAGRALFHGVSVQARSPGLYSHLGVPDTLSGRFEMFTLHAILLVARLKGRGAAAQETSQALFDAYVENMDIALREMGVGDLSMGKKMKKIGQAFYGRVKSWEAAADEADVQALIARTVFEGREGADPAPLAAYVARCRAELAAQPDADFLAGAIRWPKVD